MEFKYNEMSALTAILTRFTNECKLPITTIAKTYKLIKLVNAEIPIYQELHDKIIEEYAERDEDGQMISEQKEVNGKIVTVGVKVTNPQECSEKLRELDNIGFNIDFEPIPLALLEDFKISIPEFELFNEKLFI